MVQGTQRITGFNWIKVITDDINMLKHSESIRKVHTFSQKKVSFWVFSEYFYGF